MDIRAIACCLGAFVSSAAADDFTVLLGGTDILTPSGGTVDTVFSLAAAEGAWAGYVRTDPTDFFVMQSGAVLAHDDEPIPHVGGAFVGSTHVDIDTTGRALYRADVEPTGGGATYDAVFRAGQLLLAEGDPVGDDSLPAGAYYESFRTVNGSSSSKVLLRTRVRWHGGDVRALVVLDLDESGAIVDRDVVLKTGDPVAETTFASFMPGAGIFLDGHYQDVDGAGRVISVVRLASLDEHAIWFDGELLARENHPSPFDGAPWRSFASGDVSVNDAGDVAYKGSLDAPYLFADAIVRNGQPLIREGLPVPGLPDTEITILSEPHLDARGRVLWWCGYDDAFTLGGVALVRDDRLVASTGMRLGPGGEILASVGSHTGISPSGREVVCLARTADEELIGRFEIDEAVVDLHGGLVGSSGTPRIDAWGIVAPGEPLHLLARRATPTSQAYLVLGRGLASTSLFGGALGPSPDLVLPVVTDAGGRFEVGGPWPANIPPGAELAVQLWVVDPGAADGLSASNTLVISPLP